MATNIGYATAWLFVFGLLLTPLRTHAGVFSFVAELFTQDVEAEVNASPVNSQNIGLLEATRNPDPNIAKGGGDITVVGGVALLSEIGPEGTLADIEENQSSTISIYVVREGDTLGEIGKMFGVTTNTIAWTNNISRGIIRPGQTLVILPISGVRHTVVKGDTLQSIAKKYKADPTEIAQYNHFSETTKLAVGDVVLVPDGEIAAPPAVGRPATLRGAGGPNLDGYYLRPLIGGRKTQGLHGYNGVDIASYTGAPILASASGDVIIARSSGWNGGYGNYIVITHPNGTQTLYAHLSALTVSAGRSVTRGEIIGYVGSTGRSTGAHLHFEIRGARNPF
ncbi:MAG: M23 family metallopeptidase [bacterium]|nr:M23 family metallopeptidase [bacterium]